MKITTRPVSRLQDVEYPTDVKKIPFIELKPLKHKAPDFKIASPRQLIILISSPGTIEFIHDWLSPLYSSNQVKILGLSRGVEKSLSKYNIIPTWISPQPDIQSMMVELSLEKKKILGGEDHEFLLMHPCSLETNLKQSTFQANTGLEIRNLLVYQPVFPKPSESALLEISSNQDLVWYFYSGSAVRSFKKFYSKHRAFDMSTWKYIAVGRTSEIELEKMNLKFISMSYDEAEIELQGA